MRKLMIIVVYAIIDVIIAICLHIGMGNPHEIRFLELILLGSWVLLAITTLFTFGSSSAYRGNDRLADYQTWLAIQEIRNNTDRIAQQQQMQSQVSPSDVIK